MTTKLYSMPPYRLRDLCDDVQRTIDTLLEWHYGRYESDEDEGRKRGLMDQAATELEEAIGLLEESRNVLRAE